MQLPAPITVNREALAWACALVIDVVGKSPFRSPLHLQTTEDSLIINGSNLTQCAQVTIPATVKKNVDGAAAANLVQAIAAASGRDVELWPSGRLSVQWGHASKASVQWTETSSEWANMPSEKNTKTRELSVAQLKQLLAVGLASSQDETRIHLVGVNIGEGIIGASDGHRGHLVLTSELADIGKDLQSPTLPVKFLSTIDKLSNSVDPVKLEFSKTHCACTMQTDKGEVKIWNKLSDTEFPNIRAIVPSSTEWRFSVKTRDFADILTRAKTSGEAGVGLKPCSDGIEVTATGEAMDFYDTIEVDWLVDDEKAMGKVGVNPKYLLDACKALAGSDTVIVTGNDPMSPIAVSARSTLDAKDSILCIIMPMRL